MICGLICQFLLGVFCIRMETGRVIFRCLGNKVATFLDYSKEGAEFVYGPLLVREEVVFSFGVRNTNKTNLNNLMWHIICTLIYFFFLDTASNILL